MLVPKWANLGRVPPLGRARPDHVRADDGRKLDLYRLPGHPPRTYETLAAAAKKHFGGSLKGTITVTAGLGGMGGAQPLAVTMNDGVAIVVEVDRHRIQRRLDTRYVDTMTDRLDEALRLAEDAEKGVPLSIALLGNAADVLPELVRRGFTPDILTDQTSAHDELNGYVPNGLAYEDALILRTKDPADYIRRSMAAMAAHVKAMLDLQKRGARTFDYGNNIRGQARQAGVAEAFDIPGFVPEYIRPLFCLGKGPFRWAALSGKPADIYATDQAVLETFPEDEALARWIRKARTQVKFQGLPARICWLGYGERARFGEVINRLVRKGKISAPIVIGRDHLDTGSVASPNRETEAMRDGSTPSPTGRSSTLSSTSTGPAGFPSTTAAERASAFRSTPGW